ncbi:MAG: DMT family transporter [Acidimicrobiia bacterium]|nr:DMT family transporter [Acidimicrobiia bacterium]
MESGLLVVAVVSIASSAVLVEYAIAPAVALAFWRCLGGAVILAPRALGNPSEFHQIRRMWHLLVAAGIALGLHFASWLASLEMTSTAASVTIVSTAPLFVVGWHWQRGRPPGGRTVLGVLTAVAGVVVLFGGDLMSSDLRSGVDGDGLALVGAGCMACYLLIGDRVRSELPVRTYAPIVYAVAALTMLPVALIGAKPLVGFDSTTWLAIGAMILGPQLGGHTVLNFLLGRIGSVLVSLVLLSEAIVASALMWLIFAEVPPALAILGTPLVLCGLALAIRDARPG